MPAARRLEAVCCQLSAPAQPPTAWAATAAPATAAATTAAEQPNTPGALSGLSPEQEAHYHDQGYLVLRGIVSERDLVDLERPMYEAYKSGEDCGVDSQPGTLGSSINHTADKSVTLGFQKDDDTAPDIYPSPGRWILGQRVLSRRPEIGRILQHPAMTSAVEHAIGARGVISQFVAYDRTPGAMGTGGLPDQQPGIGAHYDYKPWRTVGSFLNWAFAIVAFSDFDEARGPLFVAPASHKLTSLMPSDGRVSHVDVGQVPQEMEMVDPELRRGDVLLMHMWTHHDAWPNRSDQHRLGMYLKFHAENTPGATGPVLFAPEARELLDGESQHRVPHTHRPGPPGEMGTTSISAVRLVLEDDAGRILLVPRPTAANGVRAIKEEGSGGMRAEMVAAYGLPLCAAATDTSSELDAENLVGCITAHVAERLGVAVPWMSWICDHEEQGSRVRVYGHRSEALPSARAALESRLESGAARWVTHEQAETILQPAERKALDMWVTSQDSDGKPVVRGVAVSNTAFGSFGERFCYNQRQGSQSLMGGEEVGKHMYRKHVVLARLAAAEEVAS